MTYPYGMVDENLEVSGYVLESIFHNRLTDDLLPLLRKYGIDDIEPKRWYPIRSLVSFFEEVVVLPQGTFDLKTIGIAAGEITVVPEHMLNAPMMEFLQFIDDISKSLHRNGHFGRHTPRLVEPGRAIMIVSTPYPDEMEFGWIQTLLKRHRLFSTVDYDPRAPTREEGARTTRFEVRWWE